MPFQIVHNDITKMNTEAIVNAANTQLLQGGGVCGAIFEAAGEKLLQKECNEIGSCKEGQAVITKGYNLKSKYIIHAVGPIWRGGDYNEEEFLKSAYRNSLEIARNKKIKSIAFPLISSGSYGYPKEKALDIAVETIKDFLTNNDIDIYLVVYDKKSVMISKKIYNTIDHYINTQYEDNKFYNNIYNKKSDSYPLEGGVTIGTIGLGMTIGAIGGLISTKLNRTISKGNNTSLNSKIENEIINKTSLNDIVFNVEESFSEMILRLIDEKGKNDVEVYKKANMDRRLFSKIRSNKEYKPKKTTVISLAIALELSLDETKDLLLRAGYSLSPSYKFDLIIQYFIENKMYDIFSINEALFSFEQPLLVA